MPALASTAVYCKPSQASARVSVPFNADECVKLRSEIKEELHARDAVLVAHYYVDSELQDLAEKAGVYPMRDSPRLFLKPANG